MSRTLSEILIDADNAKSLKELTGFSNELTSSSLIYIEKMYGLEHITELGIGIIEESKRKLLYNE